MKALVPTLLLFAIASPFAFASISVENCTGVQAYCVYGTTAEVVASTVGSAATYIQPGQKIEISGLDTGTVRVYRVLDSVYREFTVAAETDYRAQFSEHHLLVGGGEAAGTPALNVESRNALGVTFRRGFTQGTLIALTAFLIALVGALRKTDNIDLDHI